MSRPTNYGMMNGILIILLLIQLSEQQEDQPQLLLPEMYPLPVPSDANLKIMDGTSFTFQCKLGLKEDVWPTVTQLQISYEWYVVGLDQPTTRTPIWKTTFNEKEVVYHSAELKYRDKAFSAKNEISTLLDSSFLSLLNVEMGDPLLAYTSTQIDLRCEVKYRWFEYMVGQKYAIFKTEFASRYIFIEEKATSYIIGNYPGRTILYPLNSPPNLYVSPGHTHTFTVVYDHGQWSADGVTVTWKMLCQTPTDLWVVKYAEGKKVEDRAISLTHMISGSDNDMVSILTHHSLTFSNIVRISELVDTIEICCTVELPPPKQWLATSTEFSMIIVGHAKVLSTTTTSTTTTTTSTTTSTTTTTTTSTTTTTTTSTTTTEVPMTTANYSLVATTPAETSPTGRITSITFSKITFSTHRLPIADNPVRQTTKEGISEMWMAVIIVSVIVIVISTGVVVIMSWKRHVDRKAELPHAILANEWKLGANRKGYVLRQ